MLGDLVSLAAATSAWTQQCFSSLSADQGANVASMHETVTSVA
jgi:hypothetical protein